MKLKMIAAACVAVAAAGVLAAPTNAVKKALSPAEKEQARARIMQRYYENTGGRVTNPATGKGRIVFLNAQKAYPVESFKGVVENAAFTFALRMDVLDGEKPALDGADAAKKALNANAAVFVVEDPHLPLSLVAFENGWAFVNVAKLGEGPDAVRAKRLGTELVRTFALLCGMANGQGCGSLMGPVAKPEDLDLYHAPDKVNPFLAGSVQRHMELAGMSTMKVGTYRKACIEGWEPAPTNDVQKAIWQKVREQRERGPTNAIKIYPPAKGRK